MRHAAWAAGPNDAASDLATQASRGIRASRVWVARRPDPQGRFPRRVLEAVPQHNVATADFMRQTPICPQLAGR
jgi:hypothetical protein